MDHPSPREAQQACSPDKISSITHVKMSGLSGAPCGTPRCKLIFLDDAWPNFAVTMLWDHILHKTAINCLGTPFCFKALVIASCEILSNAFFKSI